VSALVRLALVFLLAVPLFAACGGDDDDDAGGPTLEGTEWTLVSGLDVEVPDDATPTLTLADGTASGFGGCNQYSGSYELDGDSLSIGPVAATMMACEEPKMAVEQAYVPALEDVDAWTVDSGELILTSEGDEILRYSGG
jgi:heat shock protein HslJ